MIRERLNSFYPRRKQFKNAEIYIEWIIFSVPPCTVQWSHTDSILLKQALQDVEQASRSKGSKWRYISCKYFNGKRKPDFLRTKSAALTFKRKRKRAFKQRSMKREAENLLKVMTIGWANLFKACETPEKAAQFFAED